MKLKQFLQRKTQVLPSPYRHRYRTSSISLHLKQLFALFLIHQRYQKRSIITETKSAEELEDKLNTITNTYLYVFSNFAFFVDLDGSVSFLYIRNKCLQLNRGIIGNLTQMCLTKKAIKYD